MWSFTSPTVGGNSKWNDSDKNPQTKVKAARCAKCGKDIPPGQEVKKGFLMKKVYHKDCLGSARPPGTITG
jgi:hypothetical protein